MCVPCTCSGWMARRSMEHMLAAQEEALLAEAAALQLDLQECEAMEGTKLGPDPCAAARSACAVASARAVAATQGHVVGGGSNDQPLHEAMQGLLYTLDVRRALLRVQAHARGSRGR